MAYSGDPILAEELLFRPERSLIDQSLHSRLGEFPTTATASAGQQLHPELEVLRHRAAR